MKVAIVGYGKMGKEIERVLKEKKIEVAAVIDKFAEGVKFRIWIKRALKALMWRLIFQCPTL